MHNGEFASRVVSMRQTTRPDPVSLTIENHFPFDNLNYTRRMFAEFVFAPG